MNFPVLLSMLLGFSSFALAQESHQPSFEHFKEVYQQSGQPSLEALPPGWYSGRCFTDYAPTTLKSGVMAILPAGNGQVKMILPAETIDDKDPAVWDQIDAEEMGFLNGYLFPHKNQPATFENGSLVSLLTYDAGFSIGKLFLREHNGHFLLKMTQTEYESEETAKTYFYCHYTGKTQDL